MPPFLKNKSCLVIGAAGSIGSNLSDRIARLKPKWLGILDQDETGIFNLLENLNEKYPKIQIQPIIASIRDELAIDVVFAEYRPQIVFHAAAYKHVYMMELFPKEAEKTNVVGTRILIDKAQSWGTEKFIFISSDKAVEPTSVMGRTKRIGEQLCLEANKHNKTRFIIVRFGNVLSSRGSVIPIFQEQIARNQNLTVRGKQMERYFMGIAEANELIIKAAEMGRGGEIYVFDMGEPMKIDDLARLMIKLSGKDLGIDYVYPKKGEKITEKLISRDECLIKTRCKKIYRVWFKKQIIGKIERKMTRKTTGETTKHRTG